MMRRFVILGHKAPLTADFTLNDLPGGAGRLDVLCRALGASLFVSHGIRKDVEAILVMQDQLHIRVVGDRVKRMNPDERSTAALLKKAIDAVSDEETESTPGTHRRGLCDCGVSGRPAGVHQCPLHTGHSPAQFQFRFLLADGGADVGDGWNGTAGRRADLAKDEPAGQSSPFRTRVAPP